jgi:hypothetical protein
MPERLIRTSADMVALFDQRARQLGLSHLEVDARAGLASGYFSKIVCGMKRPGALTIERVAAALKLGFVPITIVDALGCGDGDLKISDVPVNKASRSI